MPRIAIAECKQEVSTFNPTTSCFADFRVVSGDGLLAHHRRVREEVGGALSVLDADSRVTLAPAFGASAITSGGILTADGFKQLLDEWIDGMVRAKQAGPIDGAYFSLHGAMQAETNDDPEGALLEAARIVLGEKIPFVVSLDLHGVLTDKMLRLSNAVVPYHTYPHVDFFETGVRSAKLLMKILTEGAQPVTARVKIPALVRGDELITETGSIGECIRLAQQIEASHNGLSAGVMWGNPFTDVPELRTNSLVTLDGDVDAAKRGAIEIAQIFWKHHEKMRVPLTSLADSVLLASAIPTGTVVMMDAADATSSGASGDSNAIIREVLSQGYRGRVLAPIVDPEAVRTAFAAGVGATIHTSVGGAIDSGRFQPLPLTARVRSLSDGKFRSESFGWPWDSGDTAVLESDNITLVVGTRPVSLFDRSWFYANGQNPRHFNMVIVKSPHCEHHMFAAWCAKLINVDTPGSTSANVKSLGHQKCARPMFPLDNVTSFEPIADVFRR